MILKVLIIIYLGSIIASELAGKTTGFRRPTNWRRLLPFAMKSWTASDGKTFKCNWSFSKMYFDNPIKETP